MPSSGVNSNYSTALLSTTLEKRLPGIVDNFFDSLALFWWMKKKGRYIRTEGGTKIVAPLLHDENDTAQSYQGYDVIDITPQEGISAAEYEWREYSISIAISRREERINRGREAMANLLESKIDQAKMSFFKKFNDDLQTVRASGDKDIWSIEDAIMETVASANPAAGNFGGISSITNSFWRNVVADGAQTSTAFDNLIDKMRNVYNSCSISGGVKDLKPDVAVTDQTVYEGYEGLLEDRHRIVDNGTADAGFEHLRYKNMVLFYDEVAAAGEMRFINSQFLYFIVDKGTDFVMVPFKEPINQTAKVAHILWMGNLVCRRRDKLGLIHSIT